MAPYIDAPVERPQRPLQRRALNYWWAFASAMAALFLAACWAVHSPSQDHVGAISLRGDGTWYYNYENGFEIQDNDVFFHGIGHSIERARLADIIFLGTSRPLFAIDWRLFDEFEQKHHLKMFNMAFAGVPSGEFALQIIQKWRLTPKMWVIDLYAGSGEPSNLINNSFFHASLRSAFGASGTARVVSYSRIRAYKNIIGRNVAWRLRQAMGSLKLNSFRSAQTGNWYLDDWPNSALSGNPRMKLTDDQFCPSSPEEIESAKRYVGVIGGTVVLTQVPSRFSCARRVQAIAAGLAAPAFVVDAEQYSSPDGGGHLDRDSARRYSASFFTWFEELPEFQHLFRQTRPN
jgi:hypothetical protein